MKGATSRRALLQAAAGALVLGWLPQGRASGAWLQPAEAQAAGIELNAWVRIEAGTGRVTLSLHRAEMGQGAYDVVAQILAEELELDPDAVELVVAPGDSSRYGNQTTGGSSTVRQGMENLLRTGAGARDMLLQAAAARWAVPQAECRAELGAVLHAASGRRLHYGELVEAAARLKPAADLALKPRSAWKILGKSRSRRDLPAKVDGSAVYGIDVRIPGQLYAVVARCPRFEGRLRGFDASAALALPGVLRVLKVERDVFGHRREGVAVVARSSWAAMRGREALRVDWDEQGLEAVDSEAIRSSQLRALQQPERGSHYLSRGDVARQQADTSLTQIDAVYETPYQAHACMEPLNCTARWREGRLEIWGPIQAPDWMQQHLSRALKLPREQVVVRMNLLGGGFGRKAFTDYVHEAAVLAQQLDGQAVQLLWTREDDLSLGPFRPGMAYRVRGSLRGRGDAARLMALDVLVAGQHMDHQAPNADRSRYLSAVEEGLPETYKRSLPHWRFADVPLPLPVPVMWWRAVYSSTNAFAFESALDEMARAAEVDPLLLRRRMLWEPRAQRLLDQLETVCGWKTRAKGFGLALTHCFDTWVAQVVQLSRQGEKGVRIERVWVVVDCGVALNPDGVKAQVEGSVVMALGAATTHELRFAEGRALASNFHNYPLPRLADIPPIEVHLLRNDSPAGGAGEPALPGFAPALANAIADLGLARPRRLPFALDALTPSS